MISLAVSKLRAFYTVLLCVLGLVSFGLPMVVPEPFSSTGSSRTIATLMASVLVAAIVVGLLVEASRPTGSGMFIALLGVMCAVLSILRLIDLPLGGNSMFFFVILAGVTYGPRFGFMLGLLGMGISGIVTGGIGPWLAFQMFTTSLMGASSGTFGLLTRKLKPKIEVACLAAFGWVWGFMFGALMDFSSWTTGISFGPLSWQHGMSISETTAAFRRFYFATSFSWDAAGAFANSVLIVACGSTVLSALRRVQPRLDPKIILIETNKHANRQSTGARS